MAQDLRLALIIEAKDQASAALSRVDSSVRAIGIAAAAVTASLTAAAVGTSRLYQEVEQGLLNIKAAASATAEEYQALGAAVIKAAERTKFNPKETVDALYALTSAGLKAKDAITALNPVLDLAAATNEELGRTTENTMMVMGQFGLKAEDMTRIVDVLAASISNSMMNAQRISTAFRNGGATAGALGQSLEQTTAVLSILVNTFTTGENAGTGLKSMFNELNQSAKKLGIEIRDSQGKFLPLVDIIEKMERTGWNADKAIQAFGSDAGPAMATLLLKGSGAIREMEESLRANGQAAKMAAIQNSGLKAKWAEFSGAVDSLKLKMGAYQQVGESVLATQLKLLASSPMVTHAFEVMGYAVAQLAKMVVPAIYGIINAWIIFKNLLTLISRTEAWKTIVTFAGEIGDAFKVVFGAIFTQAEKTFPTINSFLFAIANTLNSVLMPVFRLVSAGFGSMGITGKSAGDSILLGFDKAKAGVLTAWEAVKKFATDATPAIERIKQVFSVVWTGITDAFDKIVPKIKEIAVSFGFLSTGSTTAIQNIPLDGINAIALNLNSLGLTSAVVSVLLVDGFNQIVDTITNATVSIPVMIEQVKAVLLSLEGTMQIVLHPFVAFQGYIDKLKIDMPMLTGLVAFLAEGWSYLAYIIGLGVTGIIAAVTLMGATVGIILKQIVGAIQYFIESWGLLFQELINVHVPALTIAIDRMKTRILQIFSAMGEGIRNAFVKIQGYFTGIINWAGRALAALAKFFSFQGSGGGQQQGGGAAYNPPDTQGYASGTSYIPRDGYMRLHQGERVVSNHSNSTTNLGGININAPGGGQDWRSITRNIIIPELRRAGGFA